MFSHIMVGTNDLEASSHFYDAIFAVLGHEHRFVDHLGRIFWSTATGNFAIARPIDGLQATHGNGMTIGFACDSDRMVDAWHAAGVANGGTAIEDAPGLRDAGTPMARYNAYLRDPAGNKLCAMHFIGAQEAGATA
ncbi:VOC family protein (plasmid) [Rhizorhabdus wittichii]|uniref:VOC family protein n=1 Tax=Rhizorhabdus wittichii TaxID=160791 RepID=A0A975HGX0_9SPHN|nr:VOC family protein [Rhizorhabdus wittichii]QTH24991.1 VOC family protein [Rhizorhabdus wittichii]